MQLLDNGELKACARFYSNTTWYQMASGASSVILNMEFGDMVWLKAESDTSSTYIWCDYPSCIFSGYLLQSGSDFAVTLQM